MKTRPRCIEYSVQLIEKMRDRGLDVSKIDNLIAHGYTVHHVYFPAFNWGDWTIDHIGAIHHESAGFVFDNGGTHEPNEEDFIDFVERVILAD